MSELEKIAEAEGSNGAPIKWHTIARDFCPEIWNWAKGIKVKEYKEMWLIETEKLLRKFRLVSMKMDRFSDSLIKKIRKRTYRPAAEFDSSVEPQGQASTKDNVGTGTLKKDEQRLIIEIAKNPKDAVLYEELGDLYAKMGGYRDAKESYEAAIELNSNNEELKKKLSQALEKLNP
ncbi:MAG: hypothetical protein HYX22_00315 [Candidatus Yanofskybacteria bacterium]|nr:hypothetical protein [Candidatus Yanofskybacteria bacterium]